MATTFQTYLSNFPDSDAYKPGRRLDHSSMFRECELSLRNDPTSPLPLPPDYAMQLKVHPNQESSSAVIQWCDSDGWKDTLDGVRRANSWRNFRTMPGQGHPNGLFFELNLYTRDASYVSNHHTSQQAGNTHVRDMTHDGDTVATKGTHWRTPQYHAATYGAAYRSYDSDSDSCGGDGEDGDAPDYTACDSECGWCGKCEY